MASGLPATRPTRRIPVKDAPGSLVQGRTRWRRFVVVVVPATFIAASLMVGMANGAVPASFSVSGSTFKVSADRLDGAGFVQYGGLASEKGADPKNPLDPKHHLVATSGIRDATLTNLCQSVVTPGLPVSFVIHAGREKGAPVHAKDLLIDMAQLNGDAEFTSIHIGQDASTLDAAGDGVHGTAGGFGQQATEVHITNLRQVAWSTSAGTFTLNGLDLHVSLSKEECFN
jgi:hypothetical protein